MLADRLRQVVSDITPDPLVFTNATGVEKSSVVVSNTVTVSGLGGATPISVTGGEYSINGGTFTSAAGVVLSGNTLALRHTSSASYTSLVSTTVTIGITPTSWTSTTRAQDVTANAFSFTPQTGVERSTIATSNTITVSGLDSDATGTVTITGGTYSKNAGAYTGSAGSAVNGDTFTVQATSSASYSTTVTATLSMAGQSAGFSVTTRAIDSTPNAFTFTDVTGVNPSSVNTSNTITVAGLDTGASATVSVSGGSYRKNGAAAATAGTTAVNGDTFAVVVTASSSYTTAANVTLTIGGISDTFTATTRAIDNTPNFFSTSNVSGAALSTTFTSATITVSGMDSGASCSISITGTSGSNFAYSKNGGAYTTSSGTVVNGDTIVRRITSSASNSTSVSQTLNIGGQSDTWTVTTVSQDITPDAFTFTDVTGAERSTEYISNTITISGLDAGASAGVSAVSGGSRSKNGGSYVTGNTTAVNGDTFTLKVTSSASYSTTVNCTMTIQGVADTFSVTTRAADTTPDAFSFTAVTGATLGQVYTSNTITVTGMDSGVTAGISIGGTAGYTISKNGGAFSSSAGTTAVNGDTFAMRVTASAGYSATTNGSITVGGVGATFNVTTRAADTTPDTVAFTPVTGANYSTVYTSNTVTISGVEPGYAVPCVFSGGAVARGVSKNGGAFANTVNFTVVNGDTLAVQHQSSPSQFGVTTTTLTVGTLQIPFTTTSK